jgi:hypothetical protein
LSVQGYGLGLVIAHDLHRGVTVSHAGGLPGFILFMCWHPDSGTGVVALTNSHRGRPTDLCLEALGRALARQQAPADTVVLWPETVELRAAAERLVREWDDDLAERLFSANVDFDRPLKERRAEIERLVDEVGPLRDPLPLGDIVSAVTAADVTWSIPGERGELLCMIHLTPVRPAQIQEFVVQAVPFGQPRAARPVDVSPRRAELGDAFLGSIGNVRVVVPESR